MVIVHFVDHTSNKVVSCANIPYLSGLTQDKLFAPSLLEQMKDKGIVIVFEHNSKAAAIAEKEKSADCLTGERNVACLYLGTGIGAGYIFDNKLYRGQANSSGQIGHMKVSLISNNIYSTDICSCGKSNCIEQLVRNLFTRSENGKYDFDYLEDEKIKLLSEYIAFLISNLLNCLSLDTIVITGRLSNYFDKMWPHLTAYYSEYCFDNLQSLCNVRTSRLKLFAPTYGAAICSFFKENEAEIEW